MRIETLSTGWRILRGTNCTDNGFPTRVSQLGQPSGLGTDALQSVSSAVIDFGSGGDYCENGILLAPYGVGADGNTFSLRVLSWNPVVSRQTDQAQVIEANRQWVATLLAEIQCTVSSGNPGTAGGLIVASGLFAKTITVTYGNANVSVEAVSPATSGLIATALVDVKGSKLVEITGTTGASITSFNTLYKVY